MSNSRASTFIGLAGILVALGIFILVRVLDGANVWVAKSKIGSGTSVIVMVDLSKSFAALSGRDHKMIYGLHDADRRALEAVSSGLADLASVYWKPPMKTVWTQIQASSITAQPLCAPLETVQKLVKPEGSIGTREEIQSALSSCVSKVIDASKLESNLSDFTDVSGAFAMAGDMSAGDYDERVLMMLSDFKEDLPPLAKQAAFGLNGERVVLIHRPGTDEPENVAGYLARIEGWKKKVLEHGAKAAATIPVFAMTETRLRAALQHNNVQAGTALTVLVDFKENVFPTNAGNCEKSDMLKLIAKTLAEISRDWPPPVDALWISIGSTGLSSSYLPPLEFSPSLIKKPHALNTVEDFSKAMEEEAEALPSRGKGVRATDISGSLALACSADPPTKSQVIVVVSDFVESQSVPTPFRLPQGTRVVMVHKASPPDRLDPNAYSARRDAWQTRFKQSGASIVAQIALLSLTPNDLRSALGGDSKGEE
jgi:hypothetical protein